MNWEKETFRMQTEMSELYKIPQWAKEEQLDRVMPLCRIWNLGENGVKEKRHHSGILSVKVRLAIAKWLYRMADGICPVAGKRPTAV